MPGKTLDSRLSRYASVNRPCAMRRMYSGRSCGRTRPLTVHDAVVVVGVADVGGMHAEAIIGHSRQIVEIRAEIHGVLGLGGLGGRGARGLAGSGVPGFRGSGVPGFRGSEVQRFRGSAVQRFRGSEVQRFRGSEVQRLGVQRFRGSVVQWFESGPEPRTPNPEPPSRRAKQADEHEPMNVR